MLVRPGWATAYYRCSKCGRTYAACYDNVVRAAVRPRARPPAAAPAPEETVAADEIARLKERLDRWLAAADARDPWRVLGLTPGATLDQARSRFRALAREHHPDRGGSPDEMRKFIRAWHAIRDRRAR